MPEQERAAAAVLDWGSVPEREPAAAVVLDWELGLVPERERVAVEAPEKEKVSV